MMLAAIGFLCIETMADLLQPTMMSLIVDNGVQSADVGQILRYGALMLLIAAVGAGAAFARNNLSSRVSQSVGREMRSDAYRKVQTLSFENIDRLQPASIITRLTNDVTVMVEFVNSTMRLAVKMPLTIVGAFVLLVVQSPQQTPIILALMVVGCILVALMARLSRPRFARQQRAMDGLNGVSREYLSSVRVVKAFGAEPRERARFEDAATTLALAATAAQRIPAVIGPALNLAANLGIVLLLWISQAQDPGQIGRLMASVNYTTQIVMSLGMVGGVLNGAMRALTSAGRVREIMDEVPAQSVPADPESLGEPRGDVELRDVSFRYAGATRDALSGANLHARAGQTIGIIGPTGSGKSTLVSLVPRFYDATAGAVLLDGHDVTRLAQADLREAVAVVPQRAVLFSGSIAENLRWGDGDASDERLWDALRSACADEFVRELPDGLDAQLGQGGVNLSGGQKQRLCLARALLREPRVLILDDCTSALDASTEARVLDGLRERAGSLTMLLISQRISTVCRADAIACLEGGRIQGFGTHDELMASCETYRAIYESQVGEPDTPAGANAPTSCDVGGPSAPGRPEVTPAPAGNDASGATAPGRPAHLGSPRPTGPAKGGASHGA